MRYISDGWNLIAKVNASGSVTKRFAWGIDFSGAVQGAGGVGGLPMVNVSTSTSLASHDGRGNVTTLVNAADGTVAAAYEYSPFGELVRQSGDYAATNSFRFSSKFTDNETGLVYYGRRYYSPSQGRFIGRDPIEEAGRSHGVSPLIAASCLQLQPPHCIRNRPAGVPQSRIEAS